MLKMKRCPRCKGSVRIDRDHHGWYEECLCCGHHRDMKKIEIDEAMWRSKARHGIGS